MDINALTKEYLALRDRRAQLRKHYDDEDAILKEEMAALEGQMLKFLQDNNTESVRTEAGTLYRQEDMTAIGSDWDAIYRWAAENDAFEILERRLKKTFVKDYMETHEGGVPPGVSVLREYAVRVRRS